jgi:hypothetical protein
LIFAATLRASAVTYLLLGLSDFPTANDATSLLHHRRLHPAQRIATMIADSGADQDGEGDDAIGLPDIEQRGSMLTLLPGSTIIRSRDR